MNRLIDTIKSYIEHPDIYEAGDDRAFVEQFLYYEVDHWEMRKCIESELRKWAALEIEVHGCDAQLARELADDLLGDGNTWNANEQRLIDAIFEVARNLDMPDDDDDDDDEWSQVYWTCKFNRRCGEHEHLKPYYDFTYYVCWGGGPEGGYITDGKTTYKVNRSWGEPFSVESVDGTVEVKTIDNVEQLRIVK